MSKELQELIIKKMEERNLSIRELSHRLKGKVSETSLRFFIKNNRMCSAKPYFNTVLPILQELNIEIKDFNNK